MAIIIDLKQYGYLEEKTEFETETGFETEAKTFRKTGLIPGRIIEHQREQYTVITEYGEVTAVLKGSYHHEAGRREEFPSVGDFVLLEYNPSGPSPIVRLLPRRAKFSRADFSGHAPGYAKTIREQVVAANFDYVFIVSSLNRDFKVNRIKRYLTQARQSGGQPVVILTKADLLEDFTGAAAEVRAVAPGVPVHAISSHTGLGMEALAEYLQPGKTVVFLGMSGVGKSSLLNALMNREVMTVKDIREDDSRGRHTTTHRQLFLLPDGGMVIDTPGMRELGLFDAEAGISTGFHDVEKLFPYCRFGNCRHQTEPGCAVLAALADGSLSSEHWENYLAQRRENKFVEDKSAYLKDKRTRFKSIAEENRRFKKRGKCEKNFKSAKNAD